MLQRRSYIIAIIAHRRQLAFYTRGYIMAAKAILRICWYCKYTPKHPHHVNHTSFQIRSLDCQLFQIVPMISTVATVLTHRFWLPLELQVLSSIGWYWYSSWFILIPPIGHPDSSSHGCGCDVWHLSEDTQLLAGAALAPEPQQLPNRCVFLLETQLI